MSSGEANHNQEFPVPVDSQVSVAGATEANGTPAGVNGVVKKRATVVIEPEANGNDTDEVSEQEEDEKDGDEADLLEDYPDDTEVCGRPTIIQSMKCTDSKSLFLFG